MASIAEVVEGLEILAKTASVPAGLAEHGETDTRTAHVGGAATVKASHQKRRYRGSRALLCSLTREV